MRVLLSPAVKELRTAQRRLDSARRVRDYADRRATEVHGYLQLGEVPVDVYDAAHEAQYRAHTEFHAAQRRLAEVQQSLGLLVDEDGAS